MWVVGNLICSNIFWILTVKSIRECTRNYLMNMPQPVCQIGKLSVRIGCISTDSDFRIILLQVCTCIHHWLDVPGKKLMMKSQQLLLLTASEVTLYTAPPSSPLVNCVIDNLGNKMRIAKLTYSPILSPFQQLWSLRFAKPSSQRVVMRSP